jgi:pyruvate formate lyase activating enzyme
MNGRIHSLETFGTLDGPGIRFVLFMQGCALQCQYCHNPDSWDTQIGKTVTVDDILAEIEPYLSYYQGSGGGITVSGGEPTLQAPFVADLFKACKEKWNLHTTLDSSGFCESTHAEALLSYTDLVLLDLKQMNNKRHQVLTGQPNDRILKFARWLSDRGTAMWVRHVLVPGRTDSEEDLVALGQFIGSLSGVERFEILPYHRMGIYKWEQLNKPYALTGVGSPTDLEVERAYQIIGCARAEATTNKNN